jgi:hypothetical protein
LLAALAHRERAVMTMQGKVVGSAALIVMGALLILLLYWFGGSIEGLPDAIGLPLLVIAGVLLMIAVLALAAISFALFNLDDATQALALPSGSVRAVIALSLVLLFAISSIYMYSSMNNPRTMSEDGLSLADAKGFLATLPPSQVISLRNNEGLIIPPDLDKLNSLDPKVVKDATEKYKVAYQTAHNVAADDFARQLLVMLGTLVTSVASFYFGSQAVAAAVAGSAAPAAPPAPVPSILGVAADPPFVRAAGATTASLNISGTNLNGVTTAKFVLGSSQVVATGVISNASLVKCSADFGNQPAGAWDVVVIDAFGQKATLPHAFAVPAPA